MTVDSAVRLSAISRTAQASNQAGFQNPVHGFAAPDDAIYDLRQRAGLTHVKSIAKTSGQP
jgi:hypothetical protein